MYRSEKTDIPNGYIVKLYRRTENVSEETIIKDSMFMTWMNFDCMDVERIYSFQEYYSTVKASENPPREIYASWQKLYLYNLDCKVGQSSTWTNEELLLPDDTLGKLPLITLSMLNIRWNPDDESKGRTRERYEKELRHFLAQYIASAGDVKAELYGSLAVYDYVLVLRGNDYRKLDSVLTGCRQRMKAVNIVFNKVYTIAGIDRNHLDEWKVDNLKVSVRLSCTSDITPVSLEKNEELKEAVSGHKVYSILGKYDYDIVGEVKSPEKFVALFLKGGALSAFERSIHKSNTRFFNEDGRYCVVNIPGEDGETISESCCTFLPETGFAKSSELWKEFFALYSKINALPSSIMEALSRLVLRTFQVIVTTNHFRMAGELKEKLYAFLDFIYHHQKDFQVYDISQDRVLDIYADMINTFNLMLDNRVSVGMSDFEMPQNVLRYSGASVKVLLAYSGYVDELIEILTHNKNNENRAVGKETALKYIVLVTADPVARICATVSLSYSERYRFINISIPIDLMFEAGNVLPWVTHEAGHFIRAGWNRAERNTAYFLSVERGVLNRLMPFATPLLNEGMRGKLFSRENILPENGEKFSSYCEYVTQYFQMVIYKFANDYGCEFRIPYNKARALLMDVEDITHGLQRIYEEAIADMFMLQVLEIDNLTDYLEIQEAYFRRLCMDIERLPQENVSRIMAVSVVLEGMSADNYEKIMGYFSTVYSNSSDSNIRPIIRQLKEFANYYLLKPLVIFLVRYVKKGLEELLNAPELAGVRKRIKSGYSSLKKGEFKDYLQFVLQPDK